MKYHKLVENAGRPQGFWGKMMIKAMNKGHSELTDWALAHLEIKRNYNALDIGCGGGKTVSKLCKKIGNGKAAEYFRTVQSLRTMYKPEDISDPRVLQLLKSCAGMFTKKELQRYELEQKQELLAENKDVSDVQIYDDCIDIMLYEDSF